MNLSDRIEEIIQTAVKNHEIAGGNLLLLHHGEEIAYADAGFADIEHKKPYQRDTIFRMYSMTKPVTGAAAMLLVERGVLDLGSPVSEYLPGFKNQKVYGPNGEEQAKREVTVADLLSMTSGLPYPGNPQDPASVKVEEVFNQVISEFRLENGMSTVEFANRIGDCGLSFHPGEHWMYGTSADILAAVVEVASGMKYSEFLEKEMFAPLGMKDTGFYVPAEKQHRLAKVYQAVEEGAMIYAHTNNLGICYEQDWKPLFESGGAGLVSTLDDYAGFARMLIRKGYAQDSIMSPAMVEYFTSPELMPHQQPDIWDSLPGYSYGNLMRILKQPSRSLMLGGQGEYGWDGWLGAYFCNCPKEEITFLFSTQRIDAGTLPVIRKIKNLVLSELSR